jgi:hypothetical protein
MKENQKELVIIPLNAYDNLITAQIMYNNYAIGICQFDSGIPLPTIITSPNVPQSQFMPMKAGGGGGFGAPYNTYYSYTLIFSKKEENDLSLNVAMDSIQTNGFYLLNSGTNADRSNLGVPIGTYNNIGVSPEGHRYNLKLITDLTESKIYLSRIC